MNQPSDATKTNATAAAAVKTDRSLSPEAQRALAEAEARRLQAIDDAAKAKEYYGRGGLEPVRFGDWEVKGIATDF